MLAVVLVFARRLVRRRVRHSFSEGGSPVDLSNDCGLLAKSEGPRDSVPNGPELGQFADIARDNKATISAAPSALLAYFKFLGLTAEASNEGKIEADIDSRKRQIVVGRNTVTDSSSRNPRKRLEVTWFIRADSLEKAVEIAQGNPVWITVPPVEVRPMFRRPASFRSHDSVGLRSVSRADG